MKIHSSLASLLIWEHLWFMESLYTSSKGNMVHDYRRAFALLVASSFVRWALSVCCSFTVQSILLGVSYAFCRYLIHFLVSLLTQPWSCIFPIIDHMLLVLEVLNLYPSCLTSVDTLHRGREFLCQEALNGLHTLSYMQTHIFLDIFVQFKLNSNF